MPNLLPRPPIVAILGHVDHGKTTLLDYIRKTKLTEKEHGGITQSIGAYEISTKLKGYPTDKITFIDTPGHEAFSKLRARGANVADIALLLIDAKDSVMPQTIESISHINTAKIPFIVVINKTDLPDAKPEKVKIDLTKNGVLVEGKGGNVPTINISAKTGKGVDELLETILLLSSELNLEYGLQNPLQAFILETRKDRRGSTAGIVIKDGVLKIGDVIFAGQIKGKVKAMLNDLGDNIREAAPSTPFELMGFEKLPEVGTVITTVEQEAKTKAPEEAQIETLTMESFLKKEEDKKISLIIKSDSQGSLEAINNSLVKNENIDIIHESIGEINKADIFLAKTTKAIIIGFNVRTAKDIEDLAQEEKVVIKTYKIIYELIDELTEVSSLLKEKEEKEKNVKAEAKVLATFIIHDEKVYGIKVTKGKVNLGDSIELYRDNKLLGKTKLASLKIRAKSVEGVKKDQEAGIMLFPQLDIRVGDMIKFSL